MKIIRSKKNFVIISFCTTFIIAVAMFFVMVVDPVVLMYTEAQVRSLAAKAINMAVSEALNAYMEYEDFIKTTKNTAGDIVLIEANAIEMNKLAKNLVKISQNRIELIGAQGLRVPIGTFTGIPLLLGRGPDLKINLAPVGAITSSFHSQFNSLGINTVRHRIYINLEASISVALPVKNAVIETTNQVLFCETILIGKVPDTYLNSDKLEHMLNLIP